MTGLSFTPPATMRLENFQDSRGRRAVDLTFCYSTEGPPYLELVQADPEGGVFGSEQGEGVHHLGFQEGDVRGRLDELERRHGVAAASARYGNRNPGRLHAALTVAGGLHGVRLELVDEAGRLALEEWLGSFR